MIEESQRDVSLRGQYLRWYHGIINITYLVSMHLILIGWLWFGRNLVPYTIYLISSFVVCVIYFRILSEWFHEAAHWNIVPSRAWNDWLGDVLIGTLIGTRVRSNRPLHFCHHAMQEFFVAEDPDTADQAAATRGELVSGILRDLVGYTTIRAFLSATRAGANRGKRDLPGTVAWFAWLFFVHGAAFAGTISAGYYEIYPIYMISLITLYPVANRFRLFTQHAWIREDGSVYLVRSGASRTYHGSVMTQLFLISPLIMYHYEHHARPSLPYRALRAISKESANPNEFGTRPFRMLGAVLTGIRA